jgi:hypothetical protein
MPTKVQLEKELEESNEMLKQVIELLDQMILGQRDMLDTLEGTLNIAKKRIGE